MLAVLELGAPCAPASPGSWRECVRPTPNSRITDEFGQPPDALGQTHRYGKPSALPADVDHILVVRTNSGWVPPSPGLFHHFLASSTVELASANSWRAPKPLQPLPPRNPTCGRLLLAHAGPVFGLHSASYDTTPCLLVLAYKRPTIGLPMAYSWHTVGA